MEKLIEYLRLVYRMETTHKNLIRDLGKSIVGAKSITREQFFVALHYIRKHNVDVSDWNEIRALVSEPLATLTALSNQTWFTSTSEHCSKRYWNQVGMLIKGFHQCQCAVCFSIKTDDEIDIQELWSFDDKRKIQKLVVYYPICIDCLDNTMLGDDLDSEERQGIAQYLTKINKWSFSEADEHISESLVLKKKRNQSEWLVDVDHLVTELNITPNSHRENVFDIAQKQSISHCIKSIQEDAKQDFNLAVDIDCQFSIF